MLSPLKLSVIVCGAAAGLAVAPYIVKQVLPPENALATQNTTKVAEAEVASPKVDLPIAAPSAQATVSTPAIMPVSTAAPSAKSAGPAQAELQLAAPALPSPASVSPAAPVNLDNKELSLPSLNSRETASAMPAPSMTPTPAPIPSPTPEIPYRSEVEVAQKLMRKLGIDTGKIDGKLGPNTQKAVRKFQTEHNLPESGDVNAELISSIETAVAAMATPTPAPESKVEITDSDKAGDAEKKENESVSDADDPEALLVRKETADASESKKETAKPKVDPGPVPTLQNMKDVKKIQEQLKLAGTYEGDVDGKWGDLTRAAMREFQEKAGVEVTGKPNKETWLAMHSGVVTAGGSSEKKASRAKDDAELEISSADSELTTADEEPLVVSVNGDGISDPDKVKPLATPRAVSSIDKAAESDSGKSKSEDEDEESPKVKVSTPRESDEAEAKTSSAADDPPSDLAVASDNREEQMEKLRAEIERRRAKIKSVSSDSTYEVKKYAPKMLETVNSMVDDIKVESVSNNPAAARKQLEKIDEELERTKTESMKKKAGLTVDNVRTSYDALKKNFPTRIKCLSLKNDEEKTQREELTELVAKVDLGFEAMEKDYKRGNYEPIFKNGTAFCNTIDEINRTMAEVYVTAKLDEDDVKKKLDDDLLDEIESMQKKEDYVKAADKLQAALD